ncbi:peptidoglycan-binding protein [Streptomyces sp. NPDC050422]|uniref:peptidoglycan-binding protein n=1 Tax=Streptomyces sp. NPDC050422 TaxID=3365614 RepID=UPI003796AE80
MKHLSGRKQLGALVGTMVLVGAGGWIAGTQIQSPADAAAAHNAPKAGPVTVGVQRQSLIATVVANGSIEFASPEPLSLAGSVGTGSSGGAAGEGAEQRVTKAPVAGAKIKEGDVLMAVNGRPVLALSGRVPMYRALGPGTSGDDVKQLQRALRRLGFEPGTISGNYGRGTATAVTQWYTSKGYQAQQPSPDEQQQLGQLQQSVSSAQETLLTMTGSESTGRTRATPKTDTDTDSNADSGTDSGTDSRTEAGASTPATESGNDREIRKLQLKSAQKSLEMANAALSTYQTTYGTKVPAGEAVFFPKLPVRLDKVTVKTGDSPAGQIGTVTGSDLVVQTVVPGSDGELLKKGMAVELTTAGGEKARGTVSALGADATLGADAAPPTADGGGQSTGEAAQGSEPEPGAESGGATTETAAAGDPSAPVPLRISVPDPGPLAGQAGASVKVTIKIGASDGKVLTVPLAAIRTSADGKARVQVQRDSGVSDVQVTVGLSAAGLVEVKPAGGTLKQGDNVVVGK